VQAATGGLIRMVRPMYDHILECVKSAHAHVRDSV
jgi:hypothetical protein